MSYTQTPHYALYKPAPNGDDDAWGMHLNINADVIDAALQSTSDAMGGYLPLTGGTLTGRLILNADPVGAQDAATRHYVDTKAALAMGDAPPPLVSGALWFNTVDTQLYVGYNDGTSLQWVSTTNFVGASAVPDAPNDANTYGRHAVAWVQVLPLTGGTLTGPLILAANPATALGAATKQYVDAVSTSLGNYLPLAGGTLTGALTLNADPVANLQAATKQYVDAHAGGGGGIADAPNDASTYGRHALAWTSVLPLTGGTLTGTLTLAADPTSNLQAATKNYVDTTGVLSFNTRTGAVTLALADVTGVGGAPIANPTFTGTPAAPTAAANTNTTQLATTAYVVGQAATVAPIMDAAATVGTSLLYARQDHVHPSDTTKASTTAPTITGLHETRVTMAANNVDCNAGNVFTKTISGATTLTVSNVPAAGTVATFIMDVTNGGSATITWWAGMKWAGGAAPALTAAGRDLLGFMTHDGGTTWNGLLLGKGMA